VQKNGAWGWHWTRLSFAPINLPPAIREGSDMESKLMKDNCSDFPVGKALGRKFRKLLMPSFH
jgi:hypothetical protein